MTGSQDPSNQHMVKSLLWHILPRSHVLLTTTKLRPLQPALHCKHHWMHREGKMCQIIHTHLACGHTVRGPLLQCPAASQSTPLGPPHDDGRLVLCARSEPVNTHQSTCCEACFATVFRGFLSAVCQPCRRVVVPRMGQELHDMVQRVSNDRNGADSFRNNTEEVEHMTRTRAEDAHRQTAEAYKMAEQAFVAAEASCKRATADCRKAQEACEKAVAKGEEAVEENSTVDDRSNG